MVEHIVHIDGVTGSSPVATTTIPGRKAWDTFYLANHIPSWYDYLESGSQARATMATIITEIAMTRKALDMIIRKYMGRLKIVFPVCCGISQLLEHPGEAFDVVPFLDKRCKASPQEVQEAIDGVFSPWQAEKLKVIRKHISNLDDLRDALQKLIFKLAEPYSRQIELLLTVPGISDPMTAIRVIAEIGADMRQFESSKHLCSRAGLIPQNNESANKKKTTRIGKAGQ